MKSAMKKNNILKLPRNRRIAPAELAESLRPEGLSDELNAEWMRVATILAQPGVRRRML
jgi:hypothetical protein